MSNFLFGWMLLAAPVPKDAVITQQWREFRGPDGTGAYTGPATPQKWGPTTNVGWTCPIPGLGWSSPVLHKGRIYLTTAIKQDNGDYLLKLLGIDADTGTILWEKTAFTAPAKTAERMHKKNSKASPTAVTDGERVYIHFGHLGTAAYTCEGNEVWKTGRYAYDPMHGNGGSPILLDGKLIFSCDGNDFQALIAVDCKTGAEVWRTDRASKAKLRFSFATAQVIDVDGKKQIISPASDFVAAYSPDGKELWRANYPKPGWSVICQPVYANGVVVISSGYVNQHLVAIDPTGSGDVTATHIKWTYRKNAPNTPTPLVVGNELYSISDSGVMVCLEMKTGKVYWEERLKGGGYSSSPVLVNGKIHCTSENGTGTVIEPSKTELKIIQENSMKERTFATIVPDDGALYIRTESQLFKFREKK